MRSNRKETRPGLGNKPLFLIGKITDMKSNSININTDLLYLELNEGMAL